jgi:dCTP deaminase
MSILTGPAIRSAIASKIIAITPHDDDQIDQAGVTLHLHPRLLVCRVYDPRHTNARLPPLDVRTDDGNRFVPVEVDASGAFLLRPGRFYLGATIERVHAPHHVVRVDGKSSPGRLSLEVHRTAGHIEPAFAGQITLEMAVLAPLLIPPGWPICQAVFHEVTGEVEAYTTRGSYADAGAFDGPQTSRSYRHKLRHVRQTP